MPTPTLSTLSLLDSTVLRGAIAAPAANAESDGTSFQDLLDANTETGADKSSSYTRDEKRDDRREIIAAPVNEAAQPAAPKEIKSGDEDEVVVEKRLYQNDNDRRAPDAPKKADAEKADATDRPQRAEKTEDKDANTKTEGSKEVKTLPETDNTETRDELAQDVSNRIEVLSRVLDALQALGGNPVASQAAVEHIAIKLAAFENGVATVEDAVSLKTAQAADVVVAVDTDTTVVTDAAVVPDALPADGVVTEVTPTEDMPAALKLMTVDIADQIAKLQDLLKQATPEEAVKSIPAFRALIHDIRVFSRYLDAHPEAMKDWADDKASLIHSTRGLIRELKQILATADSPDQPTAEAAPLPVDTDIATVPVKTGAVSAFVKALETVPVQNFNAPAPVTQPSSALIAAVAANSNESSQFSGQGHSNNNQQSLPQAISGVRELTASKDIQAANVPDFARIMQQVRTPVVEQIAVQIKTGLPEGASKIEIKLEPEALGKLEIKMHVDAGGKTGVTVTADNKNTLDLLQRDARGLERALSEAGLKTDSGSLSFNLRGGQQEQNQSSFASGYTPPVAGESETLSPAAVTRSYVLNMAEGLDITI